MGLFSTITKTAKKVLDTNQAIFASPITTLTKGIDAGIAATKAKSQKEIYGDIAKTTIIASGAVLTAGTTLGRTAAVAVAKTLAPKTAKGAILTAGASLIAVPALIKSPKLRESTLEAPGKLIDFGEDIGTTIEDPTSQKIKDLILENPFATSLAVGGLILGGGKIIPELVSGALTRDKIGDLEDAILKDDKPKSRFIEDPEPLVDSAPPIVPATPAVMPDVAKTAVNNTIPVLPEDKPRAKRKTTKRKSAAPTVKITNRNINKLVAVIR